MGEELTEEEKDLIEESEDINKRQKLALKAYKKVKTATGAMESIGMSPNCWWNWKKSNPTFKKFAEELEEVHIDYVESKLFELIDGVKCEDKDGNVYKRPPDKASVIFFLKTRAKHRGYSESMEIRQPDQTIAELARAFWVTELGKKMKMGLGSSDVMDKVEKALQLEAPAEDEGDDEE